MQYDKCRDVKNWHGFDLSFNFSASTSSIIKLHCSILSKSIGNRKQPAASALTAFFDLAISWENHLYNKIQQIYLCHLIRHAADSMSMTQHEFTWVYTLLYTLLYTIWPFTLPFTSLYPTSDLKFYTLAPMPAMWYCGLLFSFSHDGIHTNQPVSIESQSALYWRT